MTVRRTLSTLVFLLAGLAGTVLAQGLDLTLEVTPDPATTDDALAITVSGVGSCPALREPIVGDGIVEVPLQLDCPFLPPDPGPFTVHAVVDPLPVGRWHISIIDPFGSALVEKEILVSRSGWSVSFQPRQPTAAETVETVLHGSASCPLLTEPVRDGDLILLDVEDAGICDPPPPPSPFTLSASLGPFPAGSYELEVRSQDEPAAFARLTVLEAGDCLSSETELCLTGDRFRVAAEWSVPGEGGGTGQAIELRQDSGTFWFFDEDNLELLVKVLDACEQFDRFWFFAAGVTDVGVTLRVSDTLSGAQVVWENEAGTPFLPILDTDAFATCSE